MSLGPSRTWPTNVVGGNRFAVALLAGQSADDAWRYALDLGFAGDPASAHRSSAEAQLAAFRSPDALERVVHHPVGEINGRLFLGFRLGELVLHGWDLARSTLGDDSLDDEVLPLVWDAYQPVAGPAVKRGAFGEGPSGNVPEDAPLALRLLDLTGRRR